MYSNRASREEAAKSAREAALLRFGRTLNRRQTRRRCTEASRRRRGLWAVLRNAAALQIDGCACRRRAGDQSSGSEPLSAAATRWQERAKMTDASETRRIGRLGGSRGPSRARFAGGSPPRGKTLTTPAVPPGRPLAAPARRGRRRTTGRAWLAARAGGAPLPRYSSLRSAPLQQLRSAHRRAAGTPARERSAPASCWRRAAHEERDRTRRRQPDRQRPWRPSPRRPRMY